MPAQFTLSAIVRPACLNDADKIYGFMCDLEDMPLDSARFQAVFSHNLVDPMVHYLIADVTGVAVGFVSCHVQYLLHHAGKVGEIQELYVRPDYRTMGIGRQLMAALDALAVREEFVNLEVTTNQKRTDTVRFYERERFLRSHIKLIKPIQS